MTTENEKEGIIKKKLAPSTKSQNASHINSRHRALMRELISGATLDEASERTGFGKQRIIQLKQSPLFKNEMARLQDEVNKGFVEAEGEKQTVGYHREQMNNEVGSSIKKLVELRDKAKSERVQQISAMDILDRSGLKAPAKIEMEVAVEANEGLLIALKEAMKDMRKEDGK